MTSLNWSLVQSAALLLRPEEREAVLGDVTEGREGACKALQGVMGLVVRRQALLWKSWRPWFAGFGVTFPCSFLLMGASLSVSWSFQRLLCPELLKAAALTKGAGILVWIYQAVLLIGWSWTGGFVVGSTSRRTLWASLLLCGAPCLFCLSRYRIDTLPRSCLLLFLLPAIWGVRQGMRASRMRLVPAVLLAFVVGVLTIAAWDPGSQPPKVNLNWVLSLPAWYLVATARRPSVVAVGD